MRRIQSRCVDMKNPEINAEQANAIVRPEAKGKFLVVGDKKFYVKGVTYGTFRPSDEAGQFPNADMVRRDFRSMTESGINAIRTYTVPPMWLLDIASEYSLYVMVGLPWEQHIAFLDEPGLAGDIERRVREGVQQCAGNPAVLCYVIGNEIPASIVRWHGARRIEGFLRRLYRAVKSLVPDALVTYVNFPTTEYLRLPFLDFCCFNVYLERREQLEQYLAQLQNLAGDRPLVMAEMGLDSRRNGEIRQAEVLDWQIRNVFEAGCAGIFLFSWTDEWYRGGFEIEDWDFGLTRRNREPKPALTAVRSAFSELPFRAEVAWPRISVVVCSHNGSRTIRDTLRGLADLDYPDYEVIVVDDGSTDATAKIAAEHDVCLIRTENQGLSAARNVGLEAATGSIVAYIDDDAYPDRHWLQYLAWTFLTTPYVGVGGPNIPPANDGPIAECVARAPGGPLHVMISAREAEHIPGCNCAFRRECLQAMGGFDASFRVAGDDVDLCWRLLERGWKLGFQPAAMVWHHRRNSVRAYWKQQKGYGKAEALLERKWPAKYNAAGHLTWNGRIYGRGVPQPLGRWRIYQGTWGSALFQRLYEPAPGIAAWLPVMPEWYLVMMALSVVMALGALWPPLWYAALPLAIAALTPMVYVFKAAAHEFDERMRWPYRLLTVGLYLLQPLARLVGRVNHGLTPWRPRGEGAWVFPRPRTIQLWSEEWHSSGEWLGGLERALCGQGAVVNRGSDFDRWDLEIRGGLLGRIRTRMAVEEHGAGKQFLRCRSWPVFSFAGLGVVALFAALATGAALDHAGLAAALLAVFGLLPAGWLLEGCGGAQAYLERGLQRIAEQNKAMRIAKEAFPELQQAAEAAKATSSGAA
jgi:GT2 family glycosyltransferase